MANFKADSDVLISCGDNIVTYCDEYLKLVNDLFDSLSKLNNVAWSGPWADLYVSKLRSERSSYINFGDYLKMYGKVIKNTGVNVNTIVSKWEDR